VALNRKTRVQVGWVDVVSGRNTGRGSSLLLSVWRNF